MKSSGLSESTSSTRVKYRANNGRSELLSFAVLALSTGFSLQFIFNLDVKNTPFSILQIFFDASSDEAALVWLLEKWYQVECLYEFGVEQNMLYSEKQDGGFGTTINNASSNNKSFSLLEVIDCWVDEKFVEIRIGGIFWHRIGKLDKKILLYDWNFLRALFSSFRAEKPSEFPRLGGKRNTLGGKRFFLR